MFHFYTPWKGLLTFSGGMKYNIGLKWVKLAILNSYRVDNFQKLNLIIKVK